MDEARLAERGVVPPKLDHRVPPAPGALRRPSANGSPRYHGPDLDPVAFVEAFLSGEQRPVPDHQDRVRIDRKVRQKVTDSTWPGDVHLAIGVPQTDLHRGQATASFLPVPPRRSALPGGGKGPGPQRGRDLLRG